LALHLLAHHDALARDTARLRECYARVNLSPMGAAALAGSSLPIDRRRVAELLGFDGLVENTVDAVSSRDFVLEAMAAAAITPLAMDMPDCAFLTCMIT
jgi:argininosuccinate lyase